ncbi:hypothetical protein J2Z66_003928 [Paenibacillus eucommiae]|uniref:Uncharacterized protein n=1 Tax=Paenibacillus eucommiae TaxID=1355755 RepID=A0ABS4IZ32_9BACL|nr:hypothetical protein [Paenibacillus eucommiae]
MMENEGQMRYERGAIKGQTMDKRWTNEEQSASLC